MSQCAPTESQYWTSAQSANNSQVLVDGGGRCLDFSNKTGGSIELTACTFAGPEHFLYSTTGQIESTSRKVCLQATLATQDASIAIAKCQSGVSLQIWIIGH